MVLRQSDRVHLIGIGGSGMSALAEVLAARGARVSGSDLRCGAAVDRLRALGVRTVEGHRAAHLGDDVETIVYSTAIKPDNPELVEARRRGLRCVLRGEMLAELLRDERTIAIAGSHGKSSTTALIAHVLLKAGRDPTVLVGAPIVGLGTGGRAGASGWSVVESDESDGTFLLLEPMIAVVTNVDREHLDHFGSFEGLEAAFRRFIARVPEAGLTVLCHDDGGVRALAAESKAPVSWYGTEPGLSMSAQHIRQEGLVTRFEAWRENERLGDASMPLPGPHYALNALAALAVVLHLGVEAREALRHLASFPGLERRFAVLGTRRGVTIVDDYGHHPVEIAKTLAAARSAFPERRLVVVFEPHRYTRTRDLLSEFAPAFDGAHGLILMPVYAAGEASIAGAQGDDLARVIATRRPVIYLERLDDVLRVLETTVSEGDVVITQGAGDITKLGPALLARLESGG